MTIHKPIVIPTHKPQPTSHRPKPQQHHSTPHQPTWEELLGRR
ncbi:MAG: hypothetical protein RLZZ106_696 [Cyanobacteriota bacterium]|jgi:hypothetical protein